MSKVKTLFDINEIIRRGIGDKNYEAICRATQNKPKPSKLVKPVKTASPEAPCCTNSDQAKIDDGTKQA